MKKSAKRYNYAWVIGIIVYVLVLLLVAGCFIFRTWPGNPRAYEHFKCAHDAELLSAVTQNSANKLRQGKLVLSRWYVQGAKEVTAKDRADLAGAVFLAMELAPTYECPRQNLACGCVGEHAVSNSIPVAMSNTIPVAMSNAITMAVSNAILNAISTNKDAFLAVKISWQPNTTNTSQPDAAKQNAKPTASVLNEECLNPLTIFATNLSDAAGLIFPLVTTGNISNVTKNVLVTNFFIFERALCALEVRGKNPCGACGGECGAGCCQSKRSGWCPFHRAHKQRAQDLITPREIETYNVLLADMGAKQGGFFYYSKATDLFLLLLSVAVVGCACRVFGSIAKYLGEDKFKSRWATYYFLLPLEAAILAAGYYLLIAGGMWALPSPTNAPAVTQGTNSVPGLVLTSTNTLPLVLQPSSSLTAAESPALLALCALSFLIGMFTDEATKKLDKIAGAVFTDNKGADSLEESNPNVTATSIAPLFWLETIADQAAFAARLKDATPKPIPPGEAVPNPDPLARYIVTHPAFAPAAASLNSINNPETLESNDLINLTNKIINSLNDLIQSGLIFENDRFTGVDPNLIPKKLISKNPTGMDMVLTNWLLLQAAYNTKTNPFLNRQTTHWLVELEGTNISPNAAVVVDGAKLSIVNRVSSPLASTLRFEYQQPAVTPLQKITVVLINPPALQSDPATVTIDASITKSPS